MFNILGIKIPDLFKSDVPYFPNSKVTDDSLAYEALSRMVLILGEPSSGKTVWMAKHLLEYAKAFPDRPIFSLDRKGSLTKEFMRQVLLEPPEVREPLIRRMRYDALGHPDWVLPTPEFCSDYGLEMEDQVQRVKKNLAKLNPDLVEKNPTMGDVPISHTGPHIFRLLSCLKDTALEGTWQITEAKKLINDEGLRKRIVTAIGGNVPSTKAFFEDFFDHLSPSERYKRTGALLTVLDDIENPKSVRAKLGWSKAAWTPRQAIEQGQIILVDGSSLALHDTACEYLMLQAFSLIKAEIDMRVPDDPRNKEVITSIDEGVSFLKIPSMAPIIENIPSLDRSRKHQFYISLQHLNQVSDELRPSIWSFGNVVVFKLANFDDAKQVAKQLFPYIPDMTKLAPVTDTQQPMIEPLESQYTILANKIQRLQHRQCLIRYYKTERDMDHLVHVVARTTEVADGEANVFDLKLRLLKEHGLPVWQVNKEINSRNFGPLQRNTPS